MDPDPTIILDPISLLVGLGLAGLPLCLTLLLILRWAWNRVVRFRKIVLERNAGQPLYIHLSIDEAPAEGWLSKVKRWTTSS